MELQRKTLNAPCFKASDPEQGIIEAIVSVFGNVDSANEIVRPGFFAASLERGLPNMAWMHDWTTPVGKTLEARELAPGDVLLPEAIRDNGGLYVKGQFNLGTQRGREAFSDVQFGSVREFSIGYRATKTARDEDTGIVELLEGDLYEWSPVLVGANDSTHLLSLKSGLHDGLTFEDHSNAVLAAVEGYAARLKGLAELRARDGRTLSEAHRGRVAAIKAACDALAIPEPIDDVPDVEALQVEYMRLQARLSGVLNGVTT